MANRYGRLITAAFVLTLLFTVSNGLLTFNHLRAVQHNDDLVDHTVQVDQTLNQIQVLILKIETNTRGYLVTGSDKYLESFDPDVSRLQESLGLLKNLIADNPYQLQRLPRLSATIDERLTLLRQAIQLKQPQTSNTTQMDSIRSLVGDMTQEETRLLKLYQRQSVESYITVYLTAVIGTSLSLVLLMLTYYLIRRELREHAEIERNKDLFISLVSHELKTPITSLKLYTEAAERAIKANQPTTSHRFVTKIADQIFRLTTIVDDLLDLSRFQTGKINLQLAPVNLDNLIRETVDSLKQTTSKHKIMIKGRIGQPILADKQRIYQVLANLLTNAIKYSPSGGPITLTAHRNKRNAQVSIADPGIGIDKRFHRKIFDRLYQVNDLDRKNFAGLGIGLYVCREIIRQHGGTIWVDSHLGRGSTFSFKLPLPNPRIGKTANLAN